MSLYLGLLITIICFGISAALLFKFSSTGFQKLSALLLLIISLVVTLLTLTGYFHYFSGTERMEGYSIQLHVPLGATLVFLTICASWFWAKQFDAFDSLKLFRRVFHHAGIIIFLSSVLVSGVTIFLAMTPLFETPGQRNLIYIHIVSSWGVILSLTVIALSFILKSTSTKGNRS